MRNPILSIHVAFRLRGLPLGLIVFALLGASVSGCATINAVGAPPPEQRAQRLDAMLAAADWNVTRADTPARQEYLDSLAPLELRYVVDQKGTFHFWIADPYSCHCVFTGDQAAYTRFAEIKQATDWAETEEQSANGFVATRIQMNSCLRYGMYSGLGCTEF